MSPMAFSLDTERLDPIPCNMCGADDCRVLTERAASGAPARACLCRQCGLIYISPRMSADAYDRYYRERYRIDRSQVKDAEEPIEALFEGSRRYGAALVRRLQEYFGDGLVLDVGSSTGGVLSGVRDVLPYPVLGIEPSAVEARFARERGVETITSLCERVDPSILPRPSTILCTQSLNHLLDPRLFLERSFALLPEGGHCILAVKNFRHQARRAGRVATGVQIDHVYMFAPETLRAFVESVGFRIVYFDVDERKSRAELDRQHREGLSIGHIRLVAEKIAGARPHSPKSRLRGLKLAVELNPVALKAYYGLVYWHGLAPVRKLFS